MIPEGASPEHIHLDALMDAVRDVASAAHGPAKAGAILDVLAGLSESNRRRQCVNLLKDYRASGGGKVEFNAMKSSYGMIAKPVGMREFIQSPEYMDAANTIYPAVLEALVEIDEGDYEEAIFTGGIGSGKSTGGLYTLARTLYVLSLYENPQREFALDPASEIELVIQSATATLAKDVGFKRVKSMISKAPYFKQWFSPDPNITTQLNFPKNIMLKFLTGKDTAALGQNVYSGIIDEVNHMERVEKSVKVTSADVYNQADALYNSILNRRQSRFMRQGRLPGVLCLVGSRNYPGQFTDKKEAERLAEINEHGRSRIYLYDKCAWHIKPWQYTGETFRVFHGDSSRRPRILEKEEEVPAKDSHLISNVPEEYRPNFARDMIGSLSDVAGVSTMTRHPYITATEAIASIFGKRESILNFDYADFSQDTVKVLEGNISDPGQPRYVHIDLSRTVDCAGVACGYVKRFVPVVAKNAAESNRMHMAPEIHYDFILQVRPPPRDEIQYSEIRRLIISLRDLGLPVMFLSADAYQSTDTLQIMRQHGMRTGELSLDRDMKPYNIFRTALLDGRLHAPEHDVAKQEIVGLKVDKDKGRVDHSPGGINSKDCADAMAGVAAGLSVQRLIWGMHSISFTAAPPELTAMVAKEIGN